MTIWSASWFCESKYDQSPALGMTEIIRKITVTLIFLTHSFPNMLKLQFAVNIQQWYDVTCAEYSEYTMLLSFFQCSVAHCSWSQDIDLFKFQLSYCYNPLQDTCPITSAVLGHLIRTHVSLIFFSIGSRSPIGCLKNVQHCNVLNFS